MIAWSAPICTRSSSTKLTCSSTAAWLSPMHLPNSPCRSTAAACSVPCLPAASATGKPNVPAMSSAVAARGRQLISAAFLLSAALSKSPSRRSPGSNAMALSLYGLGSLQTSVSPVRMSLRHVAHLQHTKQATRWVRIFQATSIGAAFVADHSLRRRYRSKHPHGHLPIDASAVTSIGDAGETIFWPGSFVWASFFSSRDIGQVHFSNMKWVFCSSCVMRPLMSSIQNFYLFCIVRNRCG